MNRYHSEGGSSNPYFRYKVTVKDATDEMYHWCSTYPGRDWFDRYYVQWIQTTTTTALSKAIFQFETERPALMFALKFGHL